MSEKKKITKGLVKRLKEHLKNMADPSPDEKEVTLFEALEDLKDLIEEKIEKGHTLEKIADWLRQGGLDASTSTIKKYYYQCRKKKTEG